MTANVSNPSQTTQRTWGDFVKSATLWHEGNFHKRSSQQSGWDA